jgi:hypothetical protein
MTQVRAEGLTRDCEAFGPIHDEPLILVMGPGPGARQDLGDAPAPCAGGRGANASTPSARLTRIPCGGHEPPEASMPAIAERNAGPRAAAKAGAERRETISGDTA